MFTWGPRATERQLPQFIAYAEQSVSGGTITVPSHAANDLLIVWQRRDGGGSPSLPSGHTQHLANTTGTFLRWMVSSIVDTGNSITTFTPPTLNTTAWVVIVRFATVGAVARSAQDLLSSSTGNCPALTLTAAPSYVVCSAFSNQGYPFSVPSGLTLLGDGQSPSISNAWSVWRTSSTVSTWTGATTTWTGGAYYETFSLELVPA